MGSINFGRITGVAFFGGGRVMLAAAPVARSLGLDVKVITSPRLAGQVLSDGKTLRQLLEGLGLAFSVRETIAGDPEVTALAQSRWIGLSFGSPWIFKQPFLEEWEGRLLNNHPAPLPEHRGAGGYSWRILMGDRRNASVVHIVDAGIDTGDVIIKEPYEFPEDCRTPADCERYAEGRNVEMTRRFLEQVSSGQSFERWPQDERSSSYFPRLNTALHGWIDWRWNASQIVRFIQAFDDPYVGASTYLRGKRVRLKKAGLSEELFDFHPFQRGLVFRVADGALSVATQGGGITVGSVEFDEGAGAPGRIVVGDRFVTPVSVLDAAMEHRAVYRP